VPVVPFVPFRARLMGNMGGCESRRATGQTVPADPEKWVGVGRN